MVHWLSASKDYPFVFIHLVALCWFHVRLEMLISCVRLFQTSSSAVFRAIMFVNISSPIYPLNSNDV